MSRCDELWTSGWLSCWKRIRVAAIQTYSVDNFWNVIVDCSGNTP